MASTLFEYYQGIGKSLPTSLGGRFSDPTFADAARRAGVSQSSYTGSAAQNNAILMALQSTQSPMGSASNSGNTNTTGTPKTGTSLKDLSVGMSSGAIKTQADLDRRNAGMTSPNTGSGSQAYLTGDYALVRFVGQGQDRYMNDQTVWLLDSKTKTLRPFSSGAALSNFFDGDVNVDDITSIDASELQPGGSLGSNGGKPGFQLLAPEYAIQPDGSARRLDYSAAQLATRYGQPVNEEMEQTMFSALKGVFNMLETAGVNKSTINKIKNDDELMAFYVSSMAYGGYSVGDIYSDVKKRELGINNVSPISAVADKASYAQTADYQKASADTRLTPPVEMAGMNSAQLDLPVYQLPDEAFKTLVPILDYDSQEFKDAMASVETSYYDLLEQQLRATTEQEKAIADYNYQEWKNDVQRNFGIALSDNALEAWNQIQQVYNQGSQSGTFNSGLQAESIDSYLRQVRRQDQRVRDEKLTNEERQQMNYYLTAATPTQIKELIDTNPDKARQWGLIPSDEVKNALSLTELKKKYPNAKEEDLAQYISILLDENGNYRSQIYQKQMGTLQDLDPNSASMNTLTGLDTNKEQFQIGETYRKELLKEEDAYKEFTKPDIAFLRNSDPGAFESVTGTKAKSPTESFSSAIKKAGSSIPTPVKSPSGNTIQTPSKSTPSSALKSMSIANSPKTTTSTGTKPTPSQLSSMSAQVAAMQKTVAGLTAAKNSSAPKVSTPTSSSKSSATSSVSSKTSAADRARATRLARGAKR